jgi:multidrug efflux system membrane fusion protein
MSVLFTIPEDDLSQVTARMGQKDKLEAVAYDRTFTTKLDTGVLADIDNQVDPTTGTLKLRAMFNNKMLQLFPQQFVNVRLTLQTLQNQILVPGAAVQTGNAGSYVYVVDQGPASAALDDPPGAPASGAAGSGGRRGRRGGGRRFGGGGDFGPGAAGGPMHNVHLRPVSTGPTVGELISIRSGLSVGETVVVDGAEQLKDGALVTTPGVDQPGAAGANGSPASSPAASGPAPGAPQAPSP